MEGPSDEIELLVETQHAVTVKQVAFTFGISLNLAAVALMNLKLKNPTLFACYKISGISSQGRHIVVIPESEKDLVLSKLTIVFSNEIFSLQKQISRSSSLQLVSSILEQNRDILIKETHPEEFLSKFSSIKISDTVSIVSPRGLPKVVTATKQIAHQTLSEGEKVLHIGKKEQSLHLPPSKPTSSSKSHSNSSGGKGIASSFFKAHNTSTSSPRSSSPRDPTVTLPLPAESDPLLENTTNESAHPKIVEGKKKNKKAEDGEEDEWDGESDIDRGVLQTKNSSGKHKKFIVNSDEEEEEEVEKFNEYEGETDSKKDTNELRNGEDSDEDVEAQLISRVEKLEKMRETSEIQNNKPKSAKRKSLKQPQGENQDGPKDEAELDTGSTKRRGRKPKGMTISDNAGSKEINDVENNAKESSDCEDEKSGSKSKKKGKFEVKYGIMDSLLDEMRGQTVGGLGVGEENQEGILQDSKQKKKKLVEKMFSDEKGYLVTQMVWEEVGDFEEPITTTSPAPSSAASASTSTSSTIKSNTKPSSSSSSHKTDSSLSGKKKNSSSSSSSSSGAKKGMGGTQTGMMAFFSKKA